MEQYLDSRDLNERLEELTDLKESGDLDETDKEELKALEELKEECESSGWEYGITFIHEYYFKDYAEELFDECYSHEVPDTIKNYIDYDSFANDLEMNYTSIDFKGESYLFREA